MARVATGSTAEISEPNAKLKGKRTQESICTKYMHVRTCENRLNRDVTVGPVYY